MDNLFSLVKIIVLYLEINLSKFFNQVSIDAFFFVIYFFPSFIGFFYKCAWVSIFMAIISDSYPRFNHLAFGFFTVQKNLVYRPLIHFCSTSSLLIQSNFIYFL